MLYQKPNVSKYNMRKCRHKSDVTIYTLCSYLYMQEFQVIVIMMAWWALQLEPLEREEEEELQEQENEGEEGGVGGRGGGGGM